MELHQKLVSIQANLKAPKKQLNSFGQYHYRSAEDILEALKPLLNEYSLALTLSDEMIEVGGRVYVKATCRLMANLVPFISDDGTTNEKAQEIEVSACAREPSERKGMDDSQMTGATSSYARKYALNGMFAIDDNKDGDFQPVWWNEAIAYLNGGGQIDKIEKKYPELTEGLKTRLMDAAVKK